jgi:hypothetical protein
MIVYMIYYEYISIYKTKILMIVYMIYYEYLYLYKTKILTYFITCVKTLHVIIALNINH